MTTTTVKTTSDGFVLPLNEVQNEKGEIDDDDKASPFQEYGETLNHFNQFFDASQRRIPATPILSDIKLPSPPEFVPASGAAPYPQPTADPQKWAETVAYYRHRASHSTPPDSLDGLVSAWKQRLDISVEIIDTNIDHLMVVIRQDYPKAGEDQILSTARQIMDLVVDHNNQIRTRDKKDKVLVSGPVAVLAPPAPIPAPVVAPPLLSPAAPTPALAPAPIKLFRMDDRTRQEIQGYLKEFTDMLDEVNDNDLVIYFDNPGLIRETAIDIDIVTESPYKDRILALVQSKLEDYLTNRVKVVQHRLAQKANPPPPPPIETLKTNSNDVSDVNGDVISTLAEHQDHGIKLMELALSGTNADVRDATLFCCFQPIGYKIGIYNLLYDPYCQIYYCWNEKSRLWEPHQLKNPGSSIRMRAFKSMVSRYEHNRKILSQQAHDSNNEGFRANAEITIKKITTMISKLKTTSFMKSVWDLVLEAIGVDMKLDTNPLSPIIPLNDGYNFNIFTHERQLRTMEDRFTHSINGHFVPTITSIIPTDESSDAHKEIYDFFWKISCEDHEFAVYLITRLAICISCDMSDQTYLIMVGEANNGKSVMEKLLKSLLGTYLGTTPEGVLYDFGIAMAPNAHQGHIGALVGHRLSINTESRRARGYNGKLIKALTGGDTVDYRLPHKQETLKARIPCHLVSFGNPGDMTPVDGADAAMQKRIVLALMQAYFDTGVKLQLRERPLKVYQADLTLERKFEKPDNLNAFFTMLALAAKAYHDAGRKIATPQRIRDSTDAYLQNSFIYRDFIQEFCIENPEGRVSTSELYQLYKTVMGNKADSSHTFKREMLKRYPEVKCSIWFYKGININHAAVTALKPACRTWTVEHINDQQVQDYQRKLLPLGADQQEINGQPLTDIST